MTDRRTPMLCMMCEHDFGIDTDPHIKPCPRCGCAQRTSAKYRIEMRMTTVGKIGRHKDLSEWRIVRRVSTKTGHIVGELRVIDRRQDRYYKRLVDTVTGEELLRVDEPLSQHRGRGSARLNTHAPN